MEKKELLYEGKAKKIYATVDKEQVVVYFKDDATAFNAEKKGSFEDKGAMNNAITCLLYDFLEDQGVKTHFIKKINEREQLVKKVDIVPLEFVTRNYIAGSMAKRLGLEEGGKCENTIYDICYKKDELGDPLINDDHAVLLGAATYDELIEMYELTADVNDLLIDLFDEAGLILADFKIELGRTSDGELVLADEISPDTCRLWDKETGEKLDKDRFRRDLGGETEAYHEVHNRLLKILKQD